MRVLHVFRTPVGGLFRHVRDLARGQAALGHEIGIVCDSTTGGAAAAALLDALAPQCRLGIERLPISRLPGFGDLAAARQMAAVASRLKPALLHGHGAKGGLYARLAGRRLNLPSVYTPHGGTLHYSWRSPQGAAYLLAEKGLRGVGTGFIFVCDFERAAFERKIGIDRKPHCIVHNGLWPEDFTPIVPAADATDLLYIGELRRLKGVDVLIDAVGKLNRETRMTATIVGEGAGRQDFEAQAARLGLEGAIRFTGAMPARQALRQGRMLVMPSRAESFPYVVLETAAAGLPVIASRVGGIGEILPETSLVAAGDADALARAIRKAASCLPAVRDVAESLRSSMRSRFDASRMTARICDFYACLPGM